VNKLRLLVRLAPTLAQCIGTIVVSGCGGSGNSYGIALSPPLPSLAHDACSKFTIDYVNTEGRTTAGGGVTSATSDQVISIAATNGILYSDGECSTRLNGNLIIHAGSDSVVFGFTPATAGACSISASDVSDASVAQIGATAK